jgi:hypothetical protein
VGLWCRFGRYRTPVVGRIGTPVVEGTLGKGSVPTRVPRSILLCCRQREAGQWRCAGGGGGGPSDGQFATTSAAGRPPFPVGKVYSSPGSRLRAGAGVETRRAFVPSARQSVRGSGGSRRPRVQSPAGGPRVASWESPRLAGGWSGEPSGQRPRGARRSPCAPNRQYLWPVGGRGGRWFPRGSGTSNLCRAGIYRHAVSGSRGTGRGKA